MSTADKFPRLAFVAPEEIRRRAAEDMGPVGDSARAFLEASEHAAVATGQPLGAVERDLARVIGAAKMKPVDGLVPFFHADGSQVTESDFVAFAVSRGATAHPPKKQERPPTPTESTLEALKKSERLVAKLAKPLGAERAKRKRIQKHLDRVAEDLESVLEVRSTPLGWLARATLGGRS